MKKLISSILIVVLITLGLPACAAPLPPIHGSSVTLTWDASTQTDIVAKATVYRALPSEINWRLAGEVNAQTTSLQITNAQFGEVYYVTFSDAEGHESDRSNAVTNTLTFSGPQVLRISR